MWDDMSPFWKGYSYLVIKGCAIPIIYWKSVYMSKGGDWRKVDQWKYLKSQYCDYKLIVQAMRRPSPEAFEAAFTVNRKLLSYSIILKCLHQARRAEDSRLAQLARDEYGPEFDALFGYKRGNMWVVKCKAGDIAKQYCKEKGIAYLYEI
ncbi:hypothetical protein HYPSUDRAFT_148769 [Hypholoma sublateritium FD-334 SS-4]|uniref:Uncharacterized protein n=1 Tax=Hypholoma sublateritium (strain FD-334 SS-4) TaxID=945553 RepID=A0A0D2P5J9_HYPSF|nr:hypothetical protein HYPSUDRAFT_148769 [Hypholoma sublateritium FD-334 SS-4]